MNAPLPTVPFCGLEVSKLICGGNPLSGHSHVDSRLDREMVDFYTMPRIQELWRECERLGINTIQTRGDKHMMRAYHEHRLAGGTLQWIAQTASEFTDSQANIRLIQSYGAAAVYVHGSNTDRHWQEGRIEDIRKILLQIKDIGLPAGLGTHIPEVIQHAEEKGWETDFYMGCFYNLSRKPKQQPGVDPQAYKNERFLDEDPPRMVTTLRNCSKPCLGFKVLAAGRKCSDPEQVRRAFGFALRGLKSTDAIVVGVYQKKKNQLEENVHCVRRVLTEKFSERRLR